MSQAPFIDFVVSDWELSAEETAKGIRPTHTSKEPKRSYYIKKEDVPGFMEHYCSCVAQDQRMTMTEYPEDPAPFRLDIDLKSEHEPRFGEHLYEEQEIIDLVKVAQSEIEDIVPPSSSAVDAAVGCVLLEKKTYRTFAEDGKEKYKDGFHLHFPKLVVQSWVSGVLNKRIGTRCEKMGLFKGCYKREFDEGIASKTWLMYGSSKDLESEPYLATRFYTKDASSQDINHFFHTEKVRVCGHKKTNKPIHYFLPHFLSIHGSNATKLKERFTNQRRDLETRGKRVPRKRKEEDIAKNLKMIREGNFMALLDQDRAEEYGKWMDVGWTLFCISEGCEEGLDLWIEFSQRGSKFQEGQCEKLWQKMEDRGKTFDSLWRLLEIDNPEMMKKWVSRRFRSELDKLCWEDVKEGDVATMIAEAYRGKFICADSTKNIWYAFQDHRWREIEGGVDIKKIAANEMKKRFEKYLAKVKREEIEEERDLETSSISSVVSSKKRSGKKKMSDSEIKISNLKKAVNKLKTPNFLRGVLEMCKLHFYDGKFMDKLDKNRFIIGCENGVLDLQQKVFRDGRPDDYVSMSTGMYYKEDYDGTEPEYEKLNEILEKVYPQSSKREFMLDVLSMALGGRNNSKVFIVSVGPRNAGKSGIHDLFKTCLGEYAINSPPEIIQRGNNNSSGAARPEMLRTKGKRVQIFDEVSDSKTFDIDAIKRMTGNDPQWFRGLYDQKGQDVRPMYVTFLQCNSPPKVPTTDEALWYRMKVITMISQFSESDYPETEEEQYEKLIFPADTNFDQRIPDLAPVMLWKIFQNYCNKKTEKLTIPEEVRVDTNQYRIQNDAYQEFIIENMEKQPKSVKDGYYVSLNSLYSEFKDWYAQNFTTRFIPPRRTFKQEMIKALSTDIEANGWKGWRLKQSSCEKQDKKKF